MLDVEVMISRLAWRRVATHKMLTAVTVLAIASGVATVVGTQLMYEAVRSSYEDTAMRFAGPAALQVTNGDVGVPEEIADDIRKTPGVRAARASVEGFVSAIDWPGERLYVYGVDLLDDQQGQVYDSASSAVVSDPLVFLAEPDSAALTTEFASAHGVALHDRLRVLAPSGVVEMTVRALLGAQTGPASALDGRVVVLDLSVAQALLKFDRRYSQIAVEIAADADLQTVEAALVRTVGARGVVEQPKRRADALGRLLTNFRYGLLLAAITSVVVALYFVFNIATIAVVQRRRELGLLRALGMRRCDVMVLVAVELVGLGAVACAIGVPLGLASARALVGTFAGNVGLLYADVGVPTPRLHPSPVAWGVLLGVLTPVLAATWPLAQAVRIQPLEAWRPSSDGKHSRGPFTCAAACGTAVIIAAIGTWVVRYLLPISSESAGMIAMLGAVIGVALTVPVGVRALAERCEPIAAQVLGCVGALAGRNVVSEIGRIAVTCSAVLASLAGTIAIATWLASLDGTLHAAVDTVFSNIDLVVSSGADPFATDATRIPATVVDAIASMPEVAYLDGVRIAKAAFAGSLISLVAGDTRLYADGRRTLYVIDGDPKSAGAALAEKESVVVNQTFARRFKRARGDTLVLATPAGEARLRIAGIYFELSPGDLGAVHLDRELYRRLWRDDTVNVVELALKRDVDRRRVIDTIRARWGDRHRLIVLTIEQVRREYEAMLARLTSLVHPLLVAAIATALVGVVSARVTSLIARVRAVGVLRAVGATRRQVARMFVIEAAMIALIATALAVVAGSALGRMQVEVLLRGMFGLSILYTYPTRVTLVGVAVVLIVITLGGCVPGRSVARLRISRALRYE